MCCLFMKNIENLKWLSIITLIKPTTRRLKHMTSLRLQNKWVIMRVKNAWF